MKTMLLTICLLFPFSSYAKVESFPEKIKSVYNFHPHKLSEKQIEQKSKELDLFWKEVSAQPDQFTKYLREALTTKQHTPFFYYDGGKLLLTLSNTDEDKKLFLQSIVKSDLEDIQGTDYLSTVMGLSLDGFDVTDAAFHILTNPEFQAFIAQHALTLGQDYSLIAMLMPVKDTVYMEKAIARLDKEQDDTAVESLMKLLWYTDSPNALDAIKRKSQSSKSEKIIAIAGKLLDEEGLKVSVPEQRLQELYNSFKIPRNAGYDEMKKARSKRFNRISDEALIEMDQLTYLIKRKRVMK